jgi:hypothetical protein
MASWGHVLWAVGLARPLRPCGYDTPPHTCKSGMRTLTLLVETKRSTSVMGWLSPSGACGEVAEVETLRDPPPPRAQFPVLLAPTSP